MTTALDTTAIERMRADAATAADPFTDPAVFRKAQAILPAADRQWLEEIIGHPVPSWTRLSGAELTLAVMAAEADAAHLAALREQQAAARQAAQREQAARAAATAQAARHAWETLRASLPVPVDVCHNWTARHLDGYEQGADHIVVREDLHAGRVHRPAGRPLCWTPSRARELRHVHPNCGDETRIPDCKACLDRARKLAEVT